MHNSYRRKNEDIGDEGPLVLTLVVVLPLLQQWYLEGYSVSLCKVSAAGSGSPGVHAGKALFTAFLAKLP